MYFGEGFLLGQRSVGSRSWTLLVVALQPGNGGLVSRIWESDLKIFGCTDGSYILVKELLKCSPVYCKLRTVLSPTRSISLNSYPFEPQKLIGLNSAHQFCQPIKSWDCPALVAFQPINLQGSIEYEFKETERVRDNTEDFRHFH